MVAPYDEVADFYEAGWPDAYDDEVSLTFLELVGSVAAQSCSSSPVDIAA
jgi:hypothetical protein